MTKIFGNRDFLQQMMRLALPIALQNVLMAAFALIDTTMVAHLGDGAITAVNFATRWTFIMQITLFGVCSGASILYSQFWGARDHKGIRQVFGLTVLISLAVAVVFGALMATVPETMIRVFAGYSDEESVRSVVDMGTSFLRIFVFNCPLFALNYLLAISMRSTEEVHIPLLTSVISIAVNTGLNFVLIYGKLGVPAMGVAGAAVSTTIANLVQFVLLVALGRRRRHVIFHAVREWFEFDRRLLRKFVSVVWPVLLNEGLWVLGNSVYTFVFGRQYIAEVAAYSIYSNVDQLLFAFIIGTSNACGVLVGKAVGAGDEKGAWDNARHCLASGMLIAVGLGLLEFLLRVPLVQLIGPRSAETARLTEQLLLISSFVMPLKMGSMLFIVAIFRSGGRPLVGAIIDVGCVWLIGAPLVALAGFVWHPPFPVVFLLIFAEEIVKVSLGLVVFLRRKWIRQLTNKAPEAPALTEAGQYE